MGIKGVLWDLDGVLADTEEAHFQSWSQTLEKYGIPFSRDIFRKTFGMNNWGTLDLLLGRPPDPELYQQVSQAKEACFRQAIRGQVQPLPGVRQVLDLLRSKGILMAIASSAPPENIAALVDELALRDRFGALVSGYEMPGKPAPDVFLASARAIGVPPGACLVIEDSVAGVEGAKRAGMACLAVTNSTPAERLACADRIVESLLAADLSFWKGWLE